MIAFDKKLLLFGGYGYPSRSTQPGARFIKDSNFSDGRGWTNELHLFDLKEGEGVLHCAMTILLSNYHVLVWCCRSSLYAVEMYHIILICSVPDSSLSPLRDMVLPSC